MKKDPESTVKGGIFSLRADMLKERREWFPEHLQQQVTGGQQREVRALMPG